MEEIFKNILELSITGGFIILIILLIRLFLKEVPGIFSYILWVIPAIRLLIPVTFTGVWGIVPDKVTENRQVLPVIENYKEILYQAGAEAEEVIIKSQTEPEEAVIHGLFYWLAFIWLAGVIFMLCCGIISYIRLWHKLQVSINLEENIYLADFIPAGFVTGIFNPRIYISSALSEEEQKYVIMHERVHIKRYDYLFMPVAYILLCIHWFNPLVWLAFPEFVQDMEMSCDEKVIKEAGRKNRKKYAGIVIQVAARKVYPGIITMFHGSNVKRRVKNMMKNKKTSRKSKIITGAALFASAVLLIPDFTKTNNKVTAEQKFPYITEEKAKTKKAAEPEIVYTNKYYSLVLPENCTIQEDGFNSSLIFDNKKIATITIDENFQYGGSTERIVANWIGMNASIKSGSSFLTDKNNEFYKTVVRTELSAAMEINGGEPVTDEIHYFYLSEEKLFVDILVHDDGYITLAENLIKTFSIK